MRTCKIIESSVSRIDLRGQVDERELMLNGGIDASRQNAWHVTQEKLPEFGLESRTILLSGDHPLLCLAIPFATTSIHTDT